MAKKPEPKNEAPENRTSEVPSGYEQTSPPRGAQAWVKFSEGLEIHAKLGSRMTKKDRKSGKMRGYYLLDLLKPCQAMKKPDKDSDAEEITCEVGETVCIDEKKALECLRPLAGNGGVYNVLIRIGEKIELKNKQTFWETEVFHKLVGGKPRAPIPVQDEPEGDAGDDIPF